MCPPLVSVVICVYNGEVYLREAVDSALVQTYPSVEVLVVDDGSTDTTPAILASYGNRIRVVTQPNGGLAQARNRGIRGAAGEYICILDSDDVLLAGSIEQRIQPMLADPKMGLVMARPILIGTDGEILEQQPDVYNKTGFTFYDLVARCPCPPSCWIIRKEAFFDVGMFDQMMRSCEDWDFAIRLASVYHIAYLTSGQIKYRVVSGSMTSNSEKMYSFAKKLLWKNLIYSPSTPKYLIFAAVGLKNQLLYLHQRVKNDYSPTVAMKRIVMFNLKHPESAALYLIQCLWDCVRFLRRSSDATIRQ